MLLGLVQRWICEDPAKFRFSGSFLQGWREGEGGGRLAGRPAEPLAAGLPRALTQGLPRGRCLSHNHNLSPVPLAQTTSGAKAWLPPGRGPRTAARVGVQRRGAKCQSAARRAERGTNALERSSPTNASQGLSFALRKSMGRLWQTPPPAAPNLDLTLHCLNGYQIKGTMHIKTGSLLPAAHPKLASPSFNSDTFRQAAPSPTLAELSDSGGQSCGSAGRLRAGVQGTAASHAGRGEWSCRPSPRQPLLEARCVVWRLVEDAG